MIPALLACGPTPPAVHLEIETASDLGGLADLTCRSEPPVPLRWLREGVEVAAGEGELVIAAHEVVAGTWACEAADGELREEMTLRAPSTNLLVLLLDDVGIDNFAAYGVAPDAPPTPNLDALAAEGVRFEVAWAMPMCSPTRAALLTGRLPSRTGVGHLVDRDTAHALQLSEVTVPEVVARAGWTSALAGKWHVAPARVEFLTHPAEQGFDWHSGSHENLQVQMPTSSGESPRGYWYWEKNDNGEAAFTEAYATTDTVDDALVQAATLPEPWFLYVAFNAPHIPYDPPPEDLITQQIGPGMGEPEKYDVLVEALDTEIGRLLDGIDPEVLARTTIVTLGDNGTPDQAIAAPFARAREKGTLYEGGVRVPFIVNGPLVAEPGSVTQAFVSVTDLLPTAAALAGVPLDDGIERDGVSFLPWLADPARPSARERLFAEKFRPNGFGPYDRHDRVLKDATHRYVRASDGDEQLFRAAPEALDEGPDLLLDGPLEDEDAAALDRLRAAMDEVEARVLP